MPNPCLNVLDVGHGSAAVLHDEGGTVIFDAGRGGQVGRHLNDSGIDCLEMMILSHADADHIGGAIALLLKKDLGIGEVLLNPDSTKDSMVFEQLRYALAEAKIEKGTRIIPALTTSTQISRKGATIEVLHPPAVKALSGVGSKSTSGTCNTSNSMSAAIRVSEGSKSSVLLAADIEFDCIDEWKQQPLHPSACVLVFPHHGGLPGVNDEYNAALFGYEITRMIGPEVVVFSNHRERFGNPRDGVLSGITKANPNIRFVCTQLPPRFQSSVSVDKCWSLHRSVDGGVIDGSICILFQPSGVEIRFGNYNQLSD